MQSGASPAASYATATNNLRAAARWLLTAAAASGGVLVAGLQLTGLGSLGAGDWPRLLFACLGLAAGLGAVGYQVFQASLMLTDEWITLAQLDLEVMNRQLAGPGRRRDRRRLEQIRKIRAELENYQDEFYGAVADSISDLYRRLIEANQNARESPSPAHARKRPAQGRGGYRRAGRELRIREVGVRGAPPAPHRGRDGVRRRNRDLRLRGEPAGARAEEPAVPLSRRPRVPSP